MKWTYREEYLLKQKYPSTPASELEQLFNRSGRAIGLKARKLGLNKNREAYADTLFSGKPWNTGTKGLMKASKTSFKKGQKPHNTKKVGIRIKRRENCGIEYWYVKLSDSNWQKEQIVKWEQVNGKIPKGHILACKTTDRLNTEASNWQIITRAEHAKRNTNRQKASKTRAYNKMREAYALP